MGAMLAGLVMWAVVFGVIDVVLERRVPCGK